MSSWTSIGAGVEGRMAMADGAVRGIVRATLIPIVSVSGLPRPNLGVSAAAGLEMHSGFLTGGLMYSVERYDFPVGTQVKRLEELSALTARFGILFGKR